MHKRILKKGIYFAKYFPYPRKPVSGLKWSGSEHTVSPYHEVCMAGEKVGLESRAAQKGHSITPKVQPPVMNTSCATRDTVKGKAGGDLKVHNSNSHGLAGEDGTKLSPKGWQGQLGSSGRGNSIRMLRGE